MRESNQRACDVLKLCLAVGMTVTFLCDFPPAEAADETSDEKSSGTHHKLLIIMLDGFRWDYYANQKDELTGFSTFLQEGVQAEWVEPVFPSLSYPCWTSISTGVYPEYHGILGNYMFDINRNAVFDLNNHTTTRMVHWWQGAEPVWITATRYNRRAFLRYWSRCDVAFDEIKPERCTGYQEAKGVKAIKESLRVAVNNLQKDFDLVMMEKGSSIEYVTENEKREPKEKRGILVKGESQSELSDQVYGEHIDNVGHRYGPESPELRRAVKEVDSALSDFLDSMVDTGLDEKVNIIITGDHGMKWVGEGSEVEYLSLDKYVNATHVYKVLDRGGVIAITPYAKQVDTVYNGLKGHEEFDVYQRDEIPDYFHYKGHRLVQDLLVVAKPNYFIRGMQNSKQIPRDPSDVNFWGGVHGYANMTEMRTIFFAKGPGFKRRVVHPPIEMVDMYQIFTHLLEIPPRPHNGSWSRVVGMLTSKSAAETVCDFVLVTFSITISLLWMIKN